jgi:hypothetical protein
MEKVRFIRVRGRIVPIKNKKKREGVESAGLLAGGAVVSVGGAVGAGKLAKKARDLRTKSNIGYQNIRSSGSARAGLKKFRLRKNPAGKIVGMGGKAKSMTGQLDMFQSANKFVASKAKLSSRVGAYKSAFRARSLFKHSNVLSSALVGLGVERFLSASGIEDKDKLLGDFSSEVAGVGASFITHDVSKRVMNKVGHGESLRKGLKADMFKGFKGMKGSIGKLGKAALKRKFKI